MNRRRRLLVLIGILQIIAFVAGWLPYFAYGIKSGQYWANEASGRISSDLDRAGLLVQPRTEQQEVDLWIQTTDPIAGEIHRARGVAFWPLVGLGMGGPLVLVLGLLPERRLHRSHDSDEPLA
jgi:hypothetical protein